MTPHLFVYGTLMSTATSEIGRQERRRLAREAVGLGPAIMQSRLYDLGRYPGLVGTDDPDEIVHGEVLRLADPAKTLAWLDRYEGIDPATPRRNDYLRVEREAGLAAGLRLKAWVYVYRLNAGSARLLPEGRWPG